MASSDRYFARPSNNRYLHLSGDASRRDSSLSLSPLPMDSDSVFEFDESDIYNSVRADHNRSSLGNEVNYKSSSPSSGGRVGAPASVPVNIPDWSKILGDEYRDKQQRWRRNINNVMEEEEYEGEGGWEDCCVPPHEFLARTRVASLSVHEGVGRTLKGRDLSRVRNAIWAKTGFSD